MSETVRVFVNGRGLDAPAGGTALDAIALVLPSDSAEVQAGRMIVTDSRGLPVPADSPLYNGALFRVIPRRSREPEDASPPSTADA